MPRVAPSRAEEDENDNPVQLHHHTPNSRHYRDVSESHNNRHMLVNFEQYTIRDEAEEDDDDEAPRMSRKSNGSGGPERRRTDPRGKGDSTQRPPVYQTPHGGAPTPPPGRPPSARSQNKPSKAGIFMQWDVLSFVILLAYMLCIAITVLAIWYYRQDSAWNTIVRNEGPFPNVGNENFFSGRHLYIYQQDEGLRHAKKYLLRENRWLELMHLMFMSAFLILTLFQLAAYVTRGDEDHSKIILCYYIVFGGIGLIVALFPLLSWQTQDYNYKATAFYFQGFADRIQMADPSAYVPGKSLAAATDARTIARIMTFCHTVSQDGVTLEEDERYIEVLKRYYRLPQLQHLGFCTHHKFKIINTVLSTIFALICCAIPCIFCFQAGEDDEFEKPMRQQPMYGAPPPPPQYYNQPEGDMERGDRRERKRSRKSRGSKPYTHGYTHPDGTPLTEREINEIEKWKLFIEAEDEEEQ